MSGVEGLEAAPAGRACGACAGGLRVSHTAYAGGGRRVTVLRCAACGSLYRGQERDPDEAERRRVRAADERRARRAASGQSAGSRRRPLDEGAPANPVIDDATAARLRDLLGG